MPSCPNVKSLYLDVVNQNLGILKPANDSCSSWVPKLTSLTVRNLGGLTSLPREYVQQVTGLKVEFSHFDQTEEEYLKAFEGFASIQSLVLEYACRLMPISSIAHQLGTLERMELTDCWFHYDENHSYDSWKLLKNLRSVVITRFYVRTELEGHLKGLQHVTALQSLELRCCIDLEALPDEIGNLSSLSKLEIFGCPKLASLPQEMQKLSNLKLLVVDDCPILAPKCRKEIGVDWPKIQHIPVVIIRI